MGAGKGELGADLLRDYNQRIRKGSLFAWNVKDRPRGILPVMKFHDERGRL